MKVSVIGLGYIGLPTAALIASKKINVIGIDVNHLIVDTINNARIHIVEPNLENLVKASVESGYFIASDTVEKADVFLVTVPTPFKGHNKPDLSFIELAIKNIAPNLEQGNLIILESTSPVGSTEKIRDLLMDLRPDLTFPDEKNQDDCDISLAYCPERVLPGNILNELVNNDRVIGGVSIHCSKKAKEFYKIFVDSDCVITDCRTAELSKLVENSFRDINIAFANELSIISDKLNINVWELLSLANRHPRVNILNPGPGVGGHCIAVDPWFIVDSAPDDSKIIKLARDINDQKPFYILKKIEEAVLKTNKSVSDLDIACLGLAFKADVDDLRESPALKITINVGRLGFRKLYIVEPNIKKLPSELESNSSELVELKKAITSADIILLLVDHTEFKKTKKESFDGKLLVDTRGIWSE